MVCVFARQTSEPLASLVKKIDETVNEHDQLKSFVVILTDDADAAAEPLKTLAQDAGIRHVPLTLFENPAGPSSYQIAEDADLMVLMWKGTVVQVNHAYRGELTDDQVDAIAADIAKILSD